MPTYAIWRTKPCDYVVRILSTDGASAVITYIDGPVCRMNIPYAELRIISGIETPGLLNPQTIQKQREFIKKEEKKK